MPKSKPRELWSTPADPKRSPLRGNAAKMKSKPSEVEIVAMAMALSWASFEYNTPQEQWDQDSGKQYWRNRARAFLRALRGGR